MGKFCSECGNELIKKGNDFICPNCNLFCSKCGTKNSSDSNYCEKCGNPIIQAEKDDSSLDEVKSKERVATLDKDKTRVKIFAKPTGIALVPSIIGSRRQIKEIFKKLTSNE